MLDDNSAGGGPAPRISAPQVNPWEAPATDTSPASQPSGWGAAVHGSSACLEALGAAPQPVSAGSEASLQHMHGHAAHDAGAAQANAHAPPHSTFGAGGHQQSATAAHADGDHGLTASAAHQHYYNQHPPTQQYQQQPYGHHHYPYPYHQPYYPQPHPHMYQQQPYHHHGHHPYPQPYQYPYPNQPHTQQQGWYQYHQQHQPYAWSTYQGYGAAASNHCHEGAAAGVHAPAEPEAGSGPGSAAWTGWTSYSGSRQPEPAPTGQAGTATHVAAQPLSAGAIHPPPHVAHAVHAPQQRQQQGHATSSNAQQAEPVQDAVKQLQQARGTALADGAPDPSTHMSTIGHGTVSGGGTSFEPMTSALAAAPTPTGTLSAAAPTVAAATAHVTAVDLVVVWDLDETLIIFNSLLNGGFARAAAAAHGRGPADGDAAAAAAAKVAPGAMAAEAGPAAAGGNACGGGNASSLSREATALGQRLADFVFDFCDNHMGFQTFDRMDPLSFSELWAQASAAGEQTQPSADGRASADGGDGIVRRATLERIARVYAGGAEGLPDVIGEAGCRTLAAALAEAERLTGGWVAAARRLLAAVAPAAVAAAADGAGCAAQQSGAMASGVSPPLPTLAYRSVRHVLVSAGHLVATLGKLLLWGLDEHFDIRDVYSASGRTKLDAFRCLRGRFGPHAAFAAVGDGAEEERAAAVMGWGFVRVALSEAAAAARPRMQAAARAGTAAAAGEVAAQQPWRRPRPVAAIRAEDVLAAAREAYFD